MQFSYARMPQPNARKSKKDCLVAKVSSKISNCIFCDRSADDEVVFGKLYDIGDISCHYFCTLLSSCLVQKGDDEDGLFGFLYKDIVAEAQRGKKYKCSYCFQGGATLGCNISQCKKQFHLPCGREHNSVSLFYGNYKSFCEKHAPKQKIATEIMMKANQRLKAENRLKKSKVLGDQEISKIEYDNKCLDEAACLICYETVPGYPSTETFWPSCCRKDAWFHRRCLQRMTLASGMHYLKCPLCNDKDDFYRAVLEQGYYVPDRDAAWELEANAFAEIYERPSECTAVECKCSLGREHDADNGTWELKLCLLCGSSCVHGGCLPAQHSGHYVCALCQTVEPPDLDKLAAAEITNVTSAQGEGSQRRRCGPRVPTRMSLRRTKRNCNSLSARVAAYQGDNTSNMTETSRTSEQSTPLEPSSSKENSKDITSARLELNLRTPVRFSAYLPKCAEDEPLRDMSNILSPTKVIEDSLKDKIMQMDIQEMSVIDTKNLIEEVREKFMKPRPLSAKRKVVSDILENLLNKLSTKVNPKIQDEVVTSQSEATKLSDSDKLEAKILDEEEGEGVTTDVGQNSPKEVEIADTPVTSFVTFESERNDDEHDTKDLGHDEDTKSTFELPSEFVADCNSDASLEAFETPKKLKTVFIDNNSSIEISEKNEGVNIDVFHIQTNTDTKDGIDCGDVTNSDARSRKDLKCVLKFSPVEKEVLYSKNMDIDLEAFKSQYLNEVDRRAYKCAFSHRHEKDNDGAQTTIRSVIDFAIDAAMKKYQSENIRDIEDIAKDEPSRPIKRKFDREKDEVKGVKVKFLEAGNKSWSEKTDFKVTKEEKTQEETSCRKRQNGGSIRVSEWQRDSGTKGRGSRKKKVKNVEHSNKLMVPEGNDTTVDFTQKPTDTRRKHRKRNKNRMIHKNKLKIRFKETGKMNNGEKEKKPSVERQNKKTLKQTVLVFSSKDKILETPVKIKKKKRKSHTKSPDNMKQMSLDNFFVLKIPI